MTYRELLQQAICKLEAASLAHERAVPYLIQEAADLIRDHLAQPEQETPIKYVPVDGKLEDKYGNHPNDDEVRTDACTKALNERGDNKGQGLSPYWKWGFAAGFNAAIRAHLAQPEQEPVAWMNTKYRVAFVTNDHAEAIDSPAFKAGELVPLCTATPQRQPLTDEALEAECRRTFENYFHKIRAEMPYAHWQLAGRKVARAVEAAHGIKEAP